MSKRVLSRGRKAAPKFQFHNLRGSFQSEPGAGSRLTRTALLASAGILALSANAQAASFNVTDQTGFDTAISTARSNNASDTINLTIPTSPSFTVIRTDGSYTLPGDGQSLDLNIAPANAPSSGFNIATFAVAGGDTLTITDGTTINVAPSDVSLMRINIGDSTGAGTLNMTGGQVTFVPHNLTDPSQYSYMVIGRDGETGTFNQSGGDVELGATTVIGTDGATGTYTISGNATLGIASTTEANAGYFFIGYNQGPDTGTGTLHIEDSAQVTLDDFIRLHVGSAESGNIYAAGDGTILQDGAGSKVTFTGEEFQFGSFGDVPGGTGTYQLDAGTLILNPTTVFNLTPVQFGASAGATGQFLQNGGVFTTNANVQFGYNGTGIYNLTGGDATFSNGMTIAANLGSNGTVTQTGGVLTISGGKITYGSGTGAYNLQGGTLRTTVTDVFSNSPMTIDGGEWDLTGAGIQSIGNGFTIASSGSTLTMTLGDGHDTIAVTGNADLDGALYLHSGDGNFVLTSPYTLITTTGARNGLFDSWSDDMPFLATTLDYGTNYVNVDFAKGQSLASAGTTANEVAVGGALDNLPLGNSLFDQIVVLSEADALAAIDSMEGDIHASTKSVLTEAATYVADAALDHIHDALGGAGGAGADMTPMTSAAHPGGPGLWISGYGHSLALKDPSGNAADVSSTNGGLVAGLDFGSDGWIAGVGAGYDKASLSADSHLSSSDVDGYTALAYAGTRVGLLNLSVGGSYTGNAISSNRTVALPMTQTLTASYNGSTTQAFGEVGIGMGGFEPFAGANYIGVATDAFTETGGTADISTAASNQSVTFTTLGVRARLAAANGFWLSGMAGWRHAFGDVTPVLNGTIQGQAFAVDGAPIAADAFVAEAGIDAALGANATLGVSYLGQIGANAQDHGAKATATIRF